MWYFFDFAGTFLRPVVSLILRKYIGFFRYERITSPSRDSCRASSLPLTRV